VNKRRVDTLPRGRHFAGMRALATSTLFLSFVGLVAAAEPEPLVRVEGYHLKTERYGAAAVAAGDYVYIIAGANRSGLVSDIERLDTRTGEIQVVTTKVKPRRYHGAAVIDGKIFIVGGQAANVFNSTVNEGEATARQGGALKSVLTPRSTEAAEDYLNTPLEEASFEPTLEIFDIATGQISFGAPPPTPRISAAVAGLSGRLFLVGGVRLAGHAAAQINLNEVYDAASDRWAPGAPMPTPREANAVVVGDFVMIPGGRLHLASVAKVEFFIPAQNSWMTLPELSKPMGAGSVAFLGNHLFLFGSFGAESQVLAYDLRARKSRVIKPGFKPARHTAAVVSGNRIYVVGGNVNPEGNALTDIQVFALAETK
jgi:hypothetical protein